MEDRPVEDRPEEDCSEACFVEACFVVEVLAAGRVEAPFTLALLAFFGLELELQGVVVQLLVLVHFHAFFQLPSSCENVQIYF